MTRSKSKGANLRLLALIEQFRNGVLALLNRDRQSSGLGSSLCLHQIKSASMHYPKASPGAKQGMIHLSEVPDIGGEHQLLVGKLDQAVRDIQKPRHKLVAILLSCAQDSIGILNDHDFAGIIEQKALEYAIALH